MIARFVSLLLAGLLLATLAATGAAAQGAPPPDILDRIVATLGKRIPAVPPVFAPAASSSTDAVCGLQKMRMTLLKGTARERSYSVLADPQAGTPRDLLVRISRLSVDADGSERAYHPEDPTGRGLCQRGQDAGKLSGICALDPFTSAGLRLYRDGRQVPLTVSQKDASGRTVRALNPEFDREWKEIWPKVRGKALRSFKLEALSLKPDLPPYFYLFHDEGRRSTALFKSNIITADKGGYPCLRGPESRFPGYFIAATTVEHAGAPDRADGCKPKSFIDAELVPFFVLPFSPLGQVRVGDVVIGYLRTPDDERLVFGFAAETGPPGQFGEASYAFSRLLRGDVPETPMNVGDVNAADIGPRWLKSRDGELFILALGGSKDALRGDYSRANVERVGRARFAAWNGGEGGLSRRLKACGPHAAENGDH